MRWNCPLLMLPVLIFGFSGTVCAQGALPFQLRIQQGNDTAAIANGASIELAAPSKGASVSVKITGIYTGVNTVTIGSPQFFGSADFKLSDFAMVPGTLAPTNSFSLAASYTARITSRTLATMSIPFTEFGLENVITNSGFVTISLIGTAPEFVVAYILQSDNNTVPLSPGGSVLFGPTVLNTTATAAILVVNQGSGPGKINGISIQGADFQLQGLPLLPQSIDPARSSSFNVRFTPKSAGESSGALTISLAGSPVTQSLSGTGVISAFVYELFLQKVSQTFQSNGLLTLPDTSVGERSTAVVRVTNKGSASGVIGAGSISVTGSDFNVSDVPQLPATIGVNDFVEFSLNFAPAQPGTSAGRLRIGADTFSLTGTALGARLLYTFATGSGSTTLDRGGPVVFPPAQIGQDSLVQVTVQNKGTRGGTVASIGLDDARAPFTVENAPTFPLNLDPNASIAFAVRFRPVVLGTSTSTLRIDTQLFTISGLGTVPPRLPDYNLDLSNSNPGPLQQPTVALSLSAPYALPLSGTLTLSVTPDTTTIDPTVQFSTGGRTINFTIPANTTRAVFGFASQVRVLTGTVAGTITLTPVFTTGGGVPVGPDPPKSVSFTVRPSAPALVSVDISPLTGATFSVTVTGFSTTRALKKFDIEFTPGLRRAPSNLRITLNTDSQFSTWYNTAASQTFGSLFTAVAPFTLSDLKDITTLADIIRSVSVTASNDLGASSSLKADVP